MARCCTSFLLANLRNRASSEALRTCDNILQLIADAVKGSPKLAIVIGAEGAGLRPAVAKACDSIASIPITSDMESLNASNAAAIAFYECSKANASA